VLPLAIAGTVAAIVAVIAWAQLPSDSGAVDPTRWLGLLPGPGGGPGWARAAAAVFVVAALAALATLWWLLQRWAELARRARTTPQPYLPRLAGSFEAMETPRERLNPRRLIRMRLSRHAAAAAQRLRAEARVPRPH